MRDRRVSARFCASVCLFLLLPVLGDFNLLDVAAADAEEIETLAPVAPVADKPKPAEAEMSLLWWTVRSLGPFYGLVFLGLSFSLVALLVINLLGTRRENVVPPILVKQFEEQLSQRRYQEAYEVADADESFLGRVLSAGMAALSAGYDRALDAMQDVGRGENMKAEHRLGYLALIATVAPMVGLLGTVQGMISSFRAIAVCDNTPSPSELAEGISTALFTTFVGLLVAIPALTTYNMLRNRLAQLVLEVDVLSEELMRRFSTKELLRKGP